MQIKLEKSMYHFLSFSKITILVLQNTLLALIDGPNIQDHKKETISPNIFFEEWANFCLV